MKLCFVTDRKALAGSPDEQIRLLLEKIANAGNAGVDWVQIREKDLPSRVLAELVSGAIKRVPPACRIIVNDRLDVAYAVGAAGVHLGEHSISAADARRLWRKRNMDADFLIGASVHSIGAAQAIEELDASYLIFGPVFATPSKTRFGEPQGMEQLADVCESTRLPIIAIGGITADNAGRPHAFPAGTRRSLRGSTLSEHAIAES